MQFTETPICTSRANCFNCRNNEKFRNQMSKQYGEYICPENIPINARLEELPQTAQDNYNRLLEQRKTKENQHKEITTIFNEIENNTQGKIQELIIRLRSIILPTTKIPSQCKFCQNKIGEVEQTCCGGKIDKVDAYECTKHIITTLKKCQRCDDFLRSTNTRVGSGGQQNPTSS